MRNAPWVEPALEIACSVIGMPLSASRLSELGFNQAYELAKHLAPHKEDGRPLLRLEHGVHQLGSTRSERLDQAPNPFWHDPMRLPTPPCNRVAFLRDS